MSPSLAVCWRCDDDVVAFEDPRLDHAVAFDAEQELLATARERVRHREVLLDVLLREERPAGGDLADEREHANLADVRHETVAPAAVRSRRISSSARGLVGSRRR